MGKRFSGGVALAAMVLFCTPFAVKAGTLNADMQSHVAKLQKEAGVKAFSAEDGKKLFIAKKTHSQKNEERSCTTCHTSDPSKQGKTAVGKVIEPISPAVNKERFTDSKKVEKWFKRNCEWVFERECTPREKGDFIAYMMSL